MRSAGKLTEKEKKKKRKKEEQGSKQQSVAISFSLCNVDAVECGPRGEYVYNLG